MQERILRRTIRIALCGLLISLIAGPLYAAETFSSARAAVDFSPNGGATDAVVRERNAAQTQVFMQAYSFTAVPIAKALVEAYKRGGKILAVLDKSTEMDTYSAATFLHNSGLQPLMDDQHAIAHSKVMVMDSKTLITGSLNFTKAAEEKNAENMLVIKEAPELVQAYEAHIRLHADHSPPYLRQAALGSRGTATVTATGSGEVQGNKPTVCPSNDSASMLSYQ